MLDDGVQYKDILTIIGPLARHISEQNISNWTRGTHRYLQDLEETTARSQARRRRRAEHELASVQKVTEMAEMSIELVKKTLADIKQQAGTPGQSADIRQLTALLYALPGLITASLSAARAVTTTRASADSSKIWDPGELSSAFIQAGRETEKEAAAKAAREAGQNTAPSTQPPDKHEPPNIEPPTPSWTKPVGGDERSLYV